MSRDAFSKPSRLPTAYTQRRRLWTLGIAIIFLIVVIVAARRVDWTSSQKLSQQAQEALARGDYAESLKLGLRLIERPDRRAQGLLFVGESQGKLGHFEEALQLLRSVPENDPFIQRMAILLTARILCDDLMQPAEAEKALRKVFKDSLAAREKLSFILGLAGRSWEAIPHRLNIISQNQFQLHHLSLLALGNTAAENTDLIAKFAVVSPNDPVVQCGLARTALREGRIEDGERTLDDIIRRYPQLLAAQAWKGEVLLDRHDVNGYRSWTSALPDGADEFPDIWFVRGGWAARNDDPRVAIRCYWECLRRDSNHHAASYQLGLLLSQLGDVESAEVFREHARLLGELITAAKTIEITGSLDGCERAAAACDALGLKLEAWAWRRIDNGPGSAIQWNPQSAPRPDWSDGSPRQDPAFDPTKRIDLSTYPLPIREPTVSPGTVSTATKFTDGNSHIRFFERAKEAGIDFTYHNGNRPETDGEYIYEFSGGGIAASDFDQDGWPDLYFTQGSYDPPYLAQNKLLDRLYRNDGDGQFTDVTLLSGIRETGFSQGCSAGDFDNDGFPDLYVANIGANRFFHNNGDGTFTDITDLTKTASDRWTTSTAMADFNGDGNPDLLSVNYVTGKDLFTHACRMADGSPRLCTPHEFPAAHDQLFINLGDGRFEDQSMVAGIEVPEGKGLGIVVGAFGHSSMPSIFVANDAVPNFLFANITSGRGQPVQFEERGFLMGVAVDAVGQSQACMGVAAGDANGDGLLDLYVSNFRNESNTLYVQREDGFFTDETRQYELREPSFRMLGFGTQFLDADLDGWQDLVLTNGHVGNLKHHGIAYEMPPQFFRNLHGERFVELPSASLGPFFSGEYLGRGLARGDWNRDGREDFVVTHLKSPAAFVINETSPRGNFLIVQLRGVESERDAIGSVVSVTAGGRKIVRHLTAGDGYMASNQRHLVFGLGGETSIEHIEIRWPNGRLQAVALPEINSEMLYIENRVTGIKIGPP